MYITRTYFFARLLQSSLEFLFLNGNNCKVRPEKEDPDSLFIFPALVSRNIIEIHFPQSSARQAALV